LTLPTRGKSCRQYSNWLVKQGPGPKFAELRPQVVASYYSQQASIARFSDDVAALNDVCQKIRDMVLKHISADGGLVRLSCYLVSALSLCLPEMSYLLVEL
jgi:hypothetical protein